MKANASTTTSILIMALFLHLGISIGIPYSWGFTLNNNVEATFEEETISIHVASASCDHIGLSHEDLLQLSQKAMDQFWNSIPSSKLRLKRGSIISVDEDVFHTANLCSLESYQTAGPTGATATNCRPNPDLTFPGKGILLICNRNNREFSANSPILAATLPHIHQNKIHRAIILLNDHAEDLRTNPIKDLDHNQLLSLLAHEVGHAFGLGHSDVQDSLMYFSIRPTREHLGQDDVDGVTYLYPKRDHLLGVGFCQTTGQSPSPRPSWYLQFFLGILLSVLLFLPLRMRRKTC